MIKFVLPLVILLTFASLLVGWAVAYWHDRKQRREDEERDKVPTDDPR